MTEYLIDLRSYRPICVQNFLHDLREQYKDTSLFKKLVETSDVENLIWLLKVVDEVYLFRNGHWQFVQKYIMANVKYAFATGGTPITTWLINQIEAVLEFERVIIDQVKEMNNSDVSSEVSAVWTDLSEGYARKTKLLHDQVSELSKSDYNVTLVYKRNADLNLEDAFMK